MYPNRLPVSENSSNNVKDPSIPQTAFLLYNRHVRFLFKLPAAASRSGMLQKSLWITMNRRAAKTTRNVTFCVHRKNAPPGIPQSELALFCRGVHGIATNKLTPARLCDQNTAPKFLYIRTNQRRTDCKRTKLPPQALFFYSSHT